MNLGGVELRHIVDVDGQLIGIDAEMINASCLLRRAARGHDRRLFLLRAGERIPVMPHQHIRLNEEEVLFFETMPAPTVLAYAASPLPTRLAA